MNTIQKRGAYFHRNGCTGASAEECEGVLQSKMLNLALDSNTEVSFLPSLRGQTRIHIHITANLGDVQIEIRGLGLGHHPCGKNLRGGR